MSPGRYALHRLQDKWAICDNATDELIRGWRPGLRNLIWRGTEEEALALIAQFEKSTPREELDKTQRIHFMNRARKREKVTRVSPFHRCEDCGSMVKEGHTC